MAFWHATLYSQSPKGKTHMMNTKIYNAAKIILTLALGSAANAAPNRAEEVAKNWLSKNAKKIEKKELSPRGSIWTEIGDK